MARIARNVVIVTHSNPRVAGGALSQVLEGCAESGVRVLAPKAEFAKHGAVLPEAGADAFVKESFVDQDSTLCLVLGGDGTMLRAFRLMQGLSVPVAGVNLGRVGFLTTVEREQVKSGVGRLLKGDFAEYPLLGLEASAGEERFSAMNDVVVGRGDRATACVLALKINGVTLFEVSCDGVVVGTPAGSSAYSLAAGGPLLGISVDAYVISLVAPHAVGVRPVVAAPGDVLEVVNVDKRACYLDIDGQRVLELPPESVVKVHTQPGMMSLALLEGDSLYRHFRDRLL